MRFLSRLRSPFAWIRLGLLLALVSGLEWGGRTLHRMWVEWDAIALATGSHAQGWFLTIRSSEAWLYSPCQATITAERVLVPWWERLPGEFVVKSFSVANDGVYLGPDNFQVTWLSRDSVQVTVHAFEQADSTYLLPLEEARQGVLRNLAGHFLAVGLVVLALWGMLEWILAQPPVPLVEPPTGEEAQPSSDRF